MIHAPPNPWAMYVVGIITGFMAAVGLYEFIRSVRLSRRIKQDEASYKSAVDQIEKRKP